MIRGMMRNLAMLMVLTLPLVGVQTFAADSGAEEVAGEVVIATATGADAIDSQSYEGVETDDGIGVVATADEEGEASVTIKNDVTVTADGDGGATGAYAGAGSDGVAEVEVGGDVSATAEKETVMGIAASANGGSAEVETEGNVTAKSEEGDVIGLYAESSDGLSETEAGGDVSAVSRSGAAIGVGAVSTGGLSTGEVDGSVTARSGEREASGVYAWVEDDGEAVVKVGGDIKAEGKSDYMSDSPYDLVSGIVADLSNGSEKAKITVIAGGDVTGTDTGLLVVNDSDEETKAVADIIVEGTLGSGSGTAVLLSEKVTADNVRLTIWKLDGDVKQVVEQADTSLQAVSTDVTRAVEKNINYIIAVKPGQEDIFRGTADTAKEGETVIVRINVPSGYRLNAAYNGKGERVPLLKDANGNYYVEVKRGGGIYLSACLKALPSESCQARYMTGGCAITEMVKITYDLDGGVMPDGDRGPVIKKVPAGTMLELMEKPAKEGYVFDYWKCDDKDVTVKNPKDKFCAEKDMKFTAVWKTAAEAETAG